jgi:hypothetical protein
LLLALIGLMLGSLLGVAVTSGLAARQALAENDLGADDLGNGLDDRLSPGTTSDTNRGEPRGSQGEHSRRTPRDAGWAFGAEREPACAAPSCEDSRSSRRVEPTITRPTPTNPPRRDRRDPSAGWARLSLHPQRSHQPSSAHPSRWSPEWPIRLSGSSGLPWEEGGEQWTWG